MTDTQRELLQNNLTRVRRRISEACERSDRDPSGVTLIAVTKYHGPEVADCMVSLGVSEIGENRLQVAAPKFEGMKTRPRRHFIGPLQRNKARDVLELFDVLHSLDRPKLIRALQSRLEQLEMERYPCFLEANVSGEAAKGGFAPGELKDALDEIRAGAPRIMVAGLMTMAPYSEDPEDARPFFRRLREIRDDILPDGGLSMGMSGDFEVAVEEGATHIRVGSALFEDLDEEALIREETPS